MRNSTVGFRNLKKKQYDISNLPLHDITFELIISIHTLHKKGKIACRVLNNNRSYLQAKIKFQEHTFLKIFQPTVEMIFFFKIVGGHHQMTFGVKFSIVSRFYTFKIDISKIGITEKNPKDFIVFFFCAPLDFLLHTDMHCFHHTFEEMMQFTFLTYLEKK